MRRLLITTSILYPCFAFCNSFYQIDLIVFAHPTPKNTRSIDAPLVPISSKAISLRTDSEKSAKPYRLLSASYSSLRDEYYQLSHKSHYQVLGHYSWRQPANNKTSVALPLMEHDRWLMQGTLTVTHSNYYSFEAELQVSPPSNPQSFFTVTQKQRLKNNVIYYLDNAQIGMLVTIHTLG